MKTIRNHYSVWAVAAVLGLEALVDIGPNFQPKVPQETSFSEVITMRRVPFGGKLYRIEVRDGITTVNLED